MATPEGDNATPAIVDDAGRAGSTPAAPPAPPPLAQPPPHKPDETSPAAKWKKQNIRVSPAVIESARKDGEQLLRDLRASLNG